VVTRDTAVEHVSASSAVDGSGNHLQNAIEIKPIRQ
jgi:hypothetical protein